MEEEELQPSQSYPNLALWIIEYVWTHKMRDILGVLDSSDWPEMDPQPLSLEDSLRLRAGSAQVYSIVKNRNIEQFEKVMEFLETTFKLLPRLVTPIKHMKIMFGLKTMVIMRMLREGRGLVDTVFKINHFFPSNLPQYQDQSNQHQMFVMRKSHLDFKAFVQVLAMDKDKLEDYVKNQMEDQYGEHYAQKVEDRLLHYLHKLETVLPGDTCADKILRKGSPVTEEEKMLMEVLASDFATIATTLKKLLHCDVASCHPDGVSWSSEDEIDQTTVKSYLPETDVSQDHRSFSENDNDSDLRRHQQTEEDGEKVKRVEEESGDRGRAEISQRGGEGVQSTTSPPQFCSKHQRWVKSILQECHVECSEELQLKASVFSSPLLFQSSSSGSSSEDLTPSNLIPSPCDQQHPPLQTEVQTSEQANSKVKMHPETQLSENNTFQPEPPHLPTSKRDTLQPSMLSPVIRLIDIASIDQFLPLFECHETSPNHHQQAASSSSPQILTSGGEAIPRKTVKDSPCNQSEALVPKSPPYPALTGKSAHISQDQFTSTCCTTTTQACSTRNLKRSRPACTSDSQAMDRLRVDRSAQTTFGNCCPFNASGPLKQEPSTSQSGNRSSVCIANSVPLHGGLPQHVVLQNSESLPQKHTIPSNSLPPYKVISSTLNSNHPSAMAETSRVQKHPLKLSLRSQTLLLQSKLLQPSVSVVRLSRQECCRVTGRRSSPGHVEQPVEQGSSGDNTEGRRMEEGENEESSFDVNFLYSSSSSNSEGDNSQVCDPDYEPNIKRRLLLEYEAARSMNYT